MVVAGTHGAVWVEDATDAVGALHDVSDAAAAAAVAPFSGAGDENPYTLHTELQQTMNDLVGIIRTESEMLEALERLDDLKARAAKAKVTGGRAFNPGWHLAIDLRNMLLVAESVARAALERQESRGGHTRDDYPVMSPDWRQVNIVCRAEGDGVAIERQPIEPMREDLLALFEVSELSKYLTEAELPEGEH